TIDAPTIEAPGVSASSTDLPDIDAPASNLGTLDAGISSLDDALAGMPDINSPSPILFEKATVWHAILKWCLTLGGMLLIGGITLGKIQARRRKRFVPGPWKYSLRAPAATRPALSRDDIEEGAAYLTLQVNQEASRQLDIVRTVHATATAGGAPALVYR